MDGFFHKRSSTSFLTDIRVALARNDGAVIIQGRLAIQRLVGEDQEHTNIVGCFKESSTAEETWWQSPEN